MYFEETFTKKGEDLSNKIRVNIPNEISTTDRRIALAVEPGNTYSLAIKNFKSINYRNLLSNITGVIYSAGTSSQWFNVFSGTRESSTAANDRLYVTTSQPFTYEALDPQGNLITDNNAIYPLIIFNVTDITAPTVLTFVFDDHVNYATSYNPTNFDSYIIDRFLRINFIERDTRVAYGNSSLGFVSQLTDIVTDLLRSSQTYQLILTTVASLASYYTNFITRSSKLYLM